MNATLHAFQMHACFMTRVCHHEYMYVNMRDRVCHHEHDYRYVNMHANRGFGRYATVHFSQYACASHNTHVCMYVCYYSSMIRARMLLLLLIYASIHGCYYACIVSCHDACFLSSQPWPPVPVLCAYVVRVHVPTCMHVQMHN
jgi:hypothetical protein